MKNGDGTKDKEGIKMGKKYYYYVDFEGGRIDKCTVEGDEIKVLQLYKEDAMLVSIKWVYDDRDLRETRKEALERFSYLNELYNEGFHNKPYITEDILAGIKAELIKVQEQITEKLMYYGNFQGVTFVDNGYGDIQIQGKHREIKGYTYTSNKPIKYDFSNIDESVEEFIRMWASVDKPSYTKKIQEFLG